MSIKITQQWQQMATMESDALRPASVRRIVDSARSCNNYAAYGGAHKILTEIFPGGGTLIDNPEDTNENIVRIWAPRYVPPHFAYLAWQVGYVQESGATGTTTWTLYCSDRLYKTTEGGVMDANGLGPNVTSDSITIDSSTHAVSASSNLQIIRDDNSLVWLTLTAESSVSSSNTSWITSIDVTPVP